MVHVRLHKTVPSVALPLLLAMLLAFSSLSAKGSPADNALPQGTLSSTHGNMPQWEELGLEDLVVYSEEGSLVVQFGAKQHHNSQSSQETVSGVASPHPGKVQYQRALRFAPHSLRLTTYLYFLYRLRL